MNGHLQHRVMKAQTMAMPTTALDRSRALKSLSVTRGKLLAHKAQNLDIMAEATAEIQATNREIKEINIKMNNLRPGKEPIVTEHALLRYAERFMGVDINKIHAEIMNLPETDKIVSGNTVVTVYPTPDDHFNLAGNEKKILESY